MGPGLILILIYTFYLFARHIKITVEFGKNAGRTLMLVSILFAYGCYAIVYYFYYILKTQEVKDVFFLYYITSFVSAVIMTVGLHLIRRRMRELQEVKNTRRELAMFFGS
jgi:EamA domain-containing membrane protein RarD